jgi:hypothetical protein
VADLGDYYCSNSINMTKLFKIIFQWLFKPKNDPDYLEWVIKWFGPGSKRG